MLDCLDAMKLSCIVPVSSRMLGNLDGVCNIITRSGARSAKITATIWGGQSSHSPVPLSPLILSLIFSISRSLFAFISLPFVSLLYFPMFSSCTALIMFPLFCVSSPFLHSFHSLWFPLLLRFPFYLLFFFPLHAFPPFRCLYLCVLFPLPCYFHFLALISFSLFDHRSLPPHYCRSFSCRCYSPLMPSIPFFDLLPSLTFSFR